MSRTETSDSADRSSDYLEDELTEFEVSILAVLNGGRLSGVEIRSRLENYYGATVTHGRFYPRLDELAERGFVEKERKAFDNRTNAHELTSAGVSVLLERTQWLNSQIVRNAEP